MENTASIDRLIDQPFSTSSVPSALRYALAGVGAATWLFLVQFACCFLHAKVDHLGALSDASTCLGVLTSIVGIYMGLRWYRDGSRAQGSNCAAVNMVGLLFWALQVFLRDIPLFT